MTSPHRKEIAFTGRSSREHSNEPIPPRAEGDREELQICRDYTRGKCMRTNCRFLHPPEKYSHRGLNRPNFYREPAQDHDRGLYRGYPTPSWPPEPRRMYTEDYRQESNYLNAQVYDDPNDTRPICLDFQHDKCFRGTRCIYKHVKDPEMARYVKV